MAARHSMAARLARFGPDDLPLALLAALLLTGLVLGSIALGSGGGGSSTGACTRMLPVNVVAAPAIAPAVSALARDWEIGWRAPDGGCAQVSVTTRDGAVEASALNRGAAPPRLWIPDSVVWTSLLGTRTNDWSVEASLASSTVLFAAAGRQPTSWADLINGSGLARPLAPASSTAGLLALLTALRAVPSDQLPAVVLRVRAQALADPSAGWSALRTRPSTAVAFPTDAASMARAIAGRSGASSTATGRLSAASTATGRLSADSTATGRLSADIARPVTPAGGPRLDFPLVRLNVQDEVTGAVTALIGQLRSGAGRARFAASGLAGPSALSRFPAGQVGRLLSLWSRQPPPTATAVVLADAPQLKTRLGPDERWITAVGDALTSVVSWYPGSSGLGLTVVPAATGVASTRLSSPTRLDQPVAGRRELISGAVRALPSQPGGAGSLAPAITEAVRALSAAARPGTVSRLVVITDPVAGAMGSSELTSLDRELAAAQRLGHPVQVELVGLGASTPTGMRTLVGGTGGTVYRATSVNTVWSAIEGAICPLR